MGVKKMSKKKLNDIFTESIGENPKGFFTYLDTWALANEIEIPFFSENAVLSRDLDNYYHGLVSGDKIASSFLVNMAGEELTAAKAFLICAAWWSVNGMNVVKEYNLLLLEYDPIENYYMEEEFSDVRTGTVSSEHTGDVTDEQSGQIVNSKSGKEKDVIDSPGLKTENKVYAFDSSTAQPSGETIETGSRHIEYENYQETTTFNNNNNPLTSKRTYDDTTTKTYDDDTVTHTGSKHGNIGVTTAQRMVGSERNLWLWNFFIKYLFPTVDAVLTVPYY